MENDEEIIYLYHTGIRFLAHASLMEKDEIEKLRARFEVEAARNTGEDSVALRILSNALEPYTQD